MNKPIMVPYGFSISQNDIECDESSVRDWILNEIGKDENWVREGEMQKAASSRIVWSLGVEPILIDEEDDQEWVDKVKIYYASDIEVLLEEASKDFILPIGGSRPFVSPGSCLMAEYNPHKAARQTVDEWVPGPWQRCRWVDDDQRKKAIEADAMWTFYYRLPGEKGFSAAVADWDAMINALQNPDWGSARDVSLNER